MLNKHAAGMMLPALAFSVEKDVLLLKLLNLV